MRRVYDLSRPVAGNATRPLRRGGFSILVLTLIALATVAATGLSAPKVITYDFVAKWGTTGSAPGQLREPNGIAVAGSGAVYVADTGNQRIDEFAPSGALLASWDILNVTADSPADPDGVAVNAAGDVYVAEAAANQIQEFSATGTLITTWGSEGAGDGQFSQPAGVAVDASEDVYVADRGNDRIEKFNSGGAFLGAWGIEGAGAGQLIGPAGVAVDGSGNVFVADTGNARIEKFSSAGAFLQQWGAVGTGAPATGAFFGSPTGIAVDASGSVYVSDGLTGVLRQFSASGTLLADWSRYGSADGETKGPFGIAVDRSATVYVADTGNDRIETFRPGKPIAVPVNLSLQSAHAVTCGLKQVITQTLALTARRLCFRFVLSAKPSPGQTVKVLVSGPRGKYFALNPTAASRTSRTINVILLSSQFARGRGMWFMALKVNGQQVGQARVFNLPSTTPPPAVIAPPNPPSRSRAGREGRLTAKKVTPPPERLRPPGVKPKGSWEYIGSGKIASWVGLGTSGCLPDECPGGTDDPGMQGGLMCHQIRFYDGYNPTALKPERGEFVLGGTAEGVVDADKVPRDLKVAGIAVTISPQMWTVQGWFASQEKAMGVAWVSQCTENLKQDNEFKKMIFAENDQATAMSKADEAGKTKASGAALAKWRQIQANMMNIASFAAGAAVHG